MGETVGFALVASGHVGAGQGVQAKQLVAGVAHIATNRRVGPGLVAIAKEAQVKFDQQADGLDGVVIEAKCLHALFGELRANQIVVIERDRTAWLEFAGRRLANVVHQRGKAQGEVAL